MNECFFYRYSVLWFRVRVWIREGEGIFLFSIVFIEEILKVVIIFVILGIFQFRGSGNGNICYDFEVRRGVLGVVEGWGFREVLGNIVIGIYEDLKELFGVFLIRMKFQGFYCWEFSQVLMLCFWLFYLDFLIVVLGQ